MNELGVKRGQDFRGYAKKIYCRTLSTWNVWHIEVGFSGFDPDEGTWLAIASDASQW